MDNTHSAHRNYVLGVLVAVYTFNFIDRQILSILLEPIKRDLGLSDAWLGLLTGFAFAAFYTTFGIPIARIADRGNRRNLIALSLAAWSAMTALSGMVTQFWQLLLARIGVGIGEAGCSPAAHSMIADYFPARVRATALGVYSLGIPLGTLFGFLAGGWIAQYFGWRMALLIVGLPGLALALLVRLTVREPPRGLAERRSADGEQPGFMRTVAYLARKRSFRHLALGSGLTAFVGYGYATWMPSYLARSFGMQSGEIGTWLGLILGIPGGIGIVLGGWLADRCGARDTRWYLWTVSIALAASVPMLLAVAHAGSAATALGLFVVPAMLSNFYQATSFSQTQGMVPLRMRSVAAAVLLFVANIVGLGCGPQFIGLASDLLRASFGQESLRWALFAAAFFNLWSAFHYHRAGRYLAADIES
ncbi:MAG: spinster family MFS transporter [Gammaproteobacteria bacterium]